MNSALLFNALFLTLVDGVDPIHAMDGDAVCETSFLQSFLQIDTRMAALIDRTDATESPVPTFMEKGSKYLLAIAYSGFVVLCAGLGIAGVPSKAPQDPGVKDGCSIGCWLFLVSVYALVYCTTDQYVPSLPQMEKDLGGSQALMSGTVQMNLFVKAILGLLASGLSDHIGRRPVVLLCMLMLALASFCCACATDVKWFILARILQSMGDSVEPVVIAMFRDYFPQPEDRVRNMAALQLFGFAGISLAPFFGGLCAKYLGWRASFFFLAFMWLLMWLYAYASMEECCPDGPRESYLKDVMRILDPHLICLLLSDCLILSVYFTFNANATYLVETNFGHSVMTSSLVMLVFAVICGLGALFGDLIEMSILSKGKWAMSFLASSGIMAAILGVHFPNNLWAYLVGSCLQAIWMVPCQVAANVLFLQPLEDCAGMAASFEILAQSLPGSLLSALATQSMISSKQPALALTLWQSACCIAAGLAFWLAFCTAGLTVEGKEAELSSPDVCTAAVEAAPEDSRCT